MNINNVVYLSHGSKKYQDQTRFSALSLLALLLTQNRSDYLITVYTDSDDVVPDHPYLRKIVLPQSEFTRFRGRLDYVHRIKLEILVLSEKVVGLPFLYVDCDTKWKSLPDAEFALLRQPNGGGNAHCVMYELDGLISPNFYPQYYRRINKLNEIALRHGITIDPGNWPMWNAGAIGLHKDSGGFSAEALQISDEILPYTRLRNFVEQLAISLLAQHRFHLIPCKHHLDHFWNHSFELPIVLANFFSKKQNLTSVSELAVQCAKFDIDLTELETIQMLPQNKFMRWRKKVKNSFYKRKIDIKAFYLRCSALFQRPTFH